MRCPFLIARQTFRRQHWREIPGLDHAHAIGPDLVVAITPCFHYQKDCDENRVDWDYKMRRSRRTESERQHCPGAEHRPIRSCVEPISPGIRALHLATIKVGHRGVKFGG